MPRKYRHIKLPRGLIGSSAPRIVENGPNPQGLWPLTKQQEAERKHRIAEGLARVEEFGSRTTSVEGLPQEGYYELKVSLRRGGNKDLLKRLNIEPYRKTTEKVLEVGEGPEKKVFKEETFVGRVSTQRLEDEQYSNFDKLKQELSGYMETNYLHSYYDAISDLEPLTIDQVAETGLLDDLNSNIFGQKLMVDVVFADNAETSDAKISSIESKYPELFILKVNTRLSHYCRMKLSRSEAEKLLKDYKGIVELTHAPIFTTSEGSTSSSDDITVIDQSSNDSQPIIVADEVISDTHPLLSGPLINRLGSTTHAGNHGTQVGSLVVYGKKIPKRGIAEQKNKIIGLSVLITDPATGITTMNEPLIIDTVRDMNSSTRPLIVNLSVNNPHVLYDRSTVSPVTILLDELAHDFNCMFVISAGNMDEVNDFYHQGIRYPDYYDLPHTSIFAPADSVNNLSVGSIAYQETSESIAPRENPSPITRRGFDDKRFGFIKPDLVHYDSNCVPSGDCLEPEYNGPHVATGNTGTTNNIGTSFAAPLVSHELGVLAGHYPSYRAQTLKGLLVHFARIPENLPTTMTPERVTSLVGHGQTKIDEALNSLNTASTIVVEDEIQIKSTKKLSIPIPSALAGSHSLRLRIRTTLAYSIPPNPTDASTYSPITLTAKVNRDDDHSLSTPTTQSYLRGAHKKSNLKKYPAIEKSTTSHMGVFWNIEICADPVGDFLSDDYVQPYSLIVTIEDMQKDDTVDIHEEISQMIEVQTHSTIDISV